ncbi:hypothetical protein HK098_001034 [Nowakowskiella sp. JEL0407]|nr:hypothetical protein HK098_001034 [Nowakowskiella sp. JEL0407]
MDFSTCWITNRTVHIVGVAPAFVCLFIPDGRISHFKRFSLRNYEVNSPGHAFVVMVRPIMMALFLVVMLGVFIAVSVLLASGDNPRVANTSPALGGVSLFAVMLCFMLVGFMVWAVMRFCLNFDQDDEDGDDIQESTALSTITTMPSLLAISKSAMMYATLLCLLRTQWETAGLVGYLVIAREVV